MDPTKVFCHNPDYIARGKLGLKNSGSIGLVICRILHR